MILKIFASDVLNKCLNKLSDFESEKFISFDLINQLSSTTFIFHSVFFHATMTTYSLQYVRQLEDELDTFAVRTVNNGPCTHFHRDFENPFPLGVRLFFPYELGFCTKQLLLVKLLSNCFCLSYV